MIHDVVCHWCKKVWQDEHPDAPDAIIWCGDCNRKEIEDVWRSRPNIRIRPSPRHDIETLTRFATDHTWGMDTYGAGQMALRMKAALEMVLMFHDGAVWGADQTRRWKDLQSMIGKNPSACCTTKVLCDSIHKVLGDSIQFCILPAVREENGNPA